MTETTPAAPLWTGRTTRLAISLPDLLDFLRRYTSCNVDPFPHHVVTAALEQLLRRFGVGGGFTDQTLPIERERGPGYRYLATDSAAVSVLPWFWHGVQRQGELWVAYGTPRLAVEAAGPFCHLLLAVAGLAESGTPADWTDRISAKLLERALVRDEELPPTVLHSRIAPGILWTTADKARRFSVDQDGQGMGADGPFSPGSVRVAHRLDMKEAELESWRWHFAASADTQPFLQLDRPIYRQPGPERHAWLAKKVVGRRLPACPGASPSIMCGDLLLEWQVRGGKIRGWTLTHWGLDIVALSDLTTRRWSDLVLAIRERLP